MNPDEISGLDSLLPPIAQAFAREKLCRFKPLPFAAAALLAIAMKRFFNRPVVLITESTTFMEEMRRNLETFRQKTNDALLDFPPLENFGDGRQTEKPSQNSAGGERLRTLAHLGHYREPFLLNTSVQALMQKTFSPAALKTISLSLKSGQELDPERLVAWLEKTAYDFVNEVQERSQAARRGGLIDVWPPSEPDPLRIEFDGTTIESIRNFNPVDQRSLASFIKINDMILPPASEAASAHSRHGRADSLDKSLQIENRKSPATGWSASDGKIENSSDSLVKHLPTDTIFFWIEKCRTEPGKGARQYAGLAYHADLLEKSSADPGPSQQIITFSQLTDVIAKGNHRQCFSVLESSPWLASTRLGETLAKPGQSLGGSAADLTAIDLGFQALHNIEFVPRSFLTSDLAQENRQRWMTMLEAKARRGMKVHFFFDTQGAFDRFRATFSQYPFKLHLGTVTEGFLHDELGLGIIAELNILRPNITRRQSGRKSHPAEIRRAAPSAATGGITDLTNIEHGDLIVHANHGIGKYLGLHEIVFNGKLQETLAIEYADRAKLYVPAAQAHLLSRYFTAGGRKAKIHRLGGTQWSREKKAAEKAIYDLASSLLETQALRETVAGFAFPKDTVWQHDFEAAFPYEETDDQEMAISAVKADMESPSPMDRLVCGDAGYGKTEVAMRAAFKAVMAGKQVAVLVPTTVLALQHYEVFQQRMAAYPVRIELLCRFRSGAEQQHIAGELKKGAVDIVIGTHRLLQPDVAFKDIGLIIIDEEQRFGVEHKEHLKHLKKLSDVLTLTATPIPRTLYMSLTGARKISMIQTPPKDRLPVETMVAKNDERLVREAILRELNRGGQAFYLHNRVASIETTWSRLKQIVPEARIAIAHGQMSSRELATTMHEFSRGSFDVLLCTTIVESGVDLPNVNTILIDRADRFGIADLYQLRGRVGRSDRKAYAYLLTPVHGFLLDISRRRLGAIMEHNKLGSGFKLAMMDLEIRGAGNLLGPEQSGYISAIGFDLYCQLLRRTVESIKNAGAAKTSPALIAYPVDVEINLDFISLALKNSDPDSSAFLPTAYIEDEETRIKIYRQIASTGSLEAIEALRDEFKDRFGPLPKPFGRLLKIAAIRVMASGKNISMVESKEGKLMLTRRGEYFQIKNQFPRLHSTDADDKLKEIIGWLGRIVTPRSSLETA